MEIKQDVCESPKSHVELTSAWQDPILWEGSGVLLSLFQLLIGNQKGMLSTRQS